MTVPVEQVQGVPKRLFRAACRERQPGEFYNPILLIEVSCLRGS